jgi:hypothetical protein
VSICPKCEGEVKVIAGIEDQAVIDKILQHLQAKGALPPAPDLLPATRASPTSDWFVQHRVFTPLYTASNRRAGYLVACCLKQAGGPERLWMRVDSTGNPER